MFTLLRHCSKFKATFLLDTAVENLEPIKVSAWLLRENPELLSSCLRDHFAAGFVVFDIVSVCCRCFSTVVGTEAEFDSVMASQMQANASGSCRSSPQQQRVSRMNFVC